MAKAELAHVLAVALAARTGLRAQQRYLEEVSLPDGWDDKFLPLIERLRVVANDFAALEREVREQAD